jgi:acyl-CoA reductase-like NAD-dependent aldehyde dehydrogenase
LREGGYPFGLGRHAVIRVVTMDVSGIELFEPTIFGGVNNQMRIAREEIFGPVMCVIPFDTEEEAYSIANDTDYGLAAGVWTTNLAWAHRAYRSLRAGTVWINTYQEVNAAVPNGGVNQSGHGRISRLVFEILWGERGQDTTGYLELAGGRGPEI